MIFLCASPEICPANVATRLPTVARLIELEKDSWYFMCSLSTIWLGARAFLRIGDHVKVGSMKRALTKVKCSTRTTRFRW